VINIFSRAADNVGDAIRDFNENNLPTEYTPEMATGEHAVLGKDANLPLIVKELAPIQLDNLQREREKLTKRLDEITQYEATLHALLDAVN
jgi:hypothetical protein